MSVATVEEWVERKRRNERLVAWGSSILALFAGMMVTAILFGFLYLLANVALVMFLRVTSPSRFAVAVASFLLALAFVDTARKRREELPAHLGAGFWVIRECYGAGPWLLLSAWHNAVRATRLSDIDIVACSRVLSFLAARDTSVSREDLLRNVPSLAWSRIVDDLLLLEGVLFFRPELSRVSLIEPLRLELRRLLRAHVRPDAAESRSQTMTATDPHKLGCFELLGISPTASLQEIKLAYRRRMKECHPDRFATVGKQYQPLAEEWAKAINAAYHNLLERKAAESVATRF